MCEARLGRWAPDQLVEVVPAALALGCEPPALSGAPSRVPYGAVTRQGSV